MKKILVVLICILITGQSQASGDLNTLKTLLTKEEFLSGQENIYRCHLTNYKRTSGAAFFNKYISFSNIPPFPPANPNETLYMILTPEFIGLAGLLEYKTDNDATAGSIAKIVPVSYYRLLVGSNELGVEDSQNILSSLRVDQGNGVILERKFATSFEAKLEKEDQGLINSVYAKYKTNIRYDAGVEGFSKIEINFDRKNKNLVTRVTYKSLAGASQEKHTMACENLPNGWISR